MALRAVCCMAPALERGSQVYSEVEPSGAAGRTNMLICSSERAHDGGPLIPARLSLAAAFADAGIPWL